jgi:hypothetical protein
MNRLICASVPDGHYYSSLVWLHFSETSVNVYQNTLRHVPEDNKLFRVYILFRVPQFCAMSHY